MGIKHETGGTQSTASLKSGKIDGTIILILTRMRERVSAGSGERLIERERREGGERGGGERKGGELERDRHCVHTI